jgi:hypothetical protein
MVSVVHHRLQQPVLVIAAQADDVARCLFSKRENSLDARFGIGTAVDVVAKKHNRIGRGGFVVNLRQKLLERFECAVDVANRDGRH